jgi:hypothetical protein
VTSALNESGRVAIKLSRAARRSVWRAWPVPSPLRMAHGIPESRHGAEMVAWVEREEPLEEAGFVRSR